jgi:DNA-binding transcriptional LysR family regulator/FixJ family two-component response regulator
MTAPLICIVDDDRLLRASVADLLKAEGFRTAEFSTARAFLASEEKLSCKCVLADIQMPGMTGIDLKRALAAEGLMIPVIVITALTEDHWRDRATESGAEFLRKPFEAAALFGLVNQSIASRRGRHKAVRASSQRLEKGVTMELHQIRYFLALAQSLNFTRAAEQCNVTQPALTKAIQKLELELGGALIHRERQLTQLTDLGKLVLPMLERADTAAQSVRASAQEFRRREIAPLKIALASCVSASILEAPLMEIARFMPGLQVELVEAEPSEVDGLLLNGEVSAALLGDDAGAAPSRIDHWKLFEERLLLLTQKNSRFAEDGIVPLTLLPDASWLERTHCEGTSRLWNILFPQGGQPNIVHRGRHLGHLQHMVSAGLGVMLWPEHAPHLDSVVALPIEGDQLRRNIELRVVQGRQYAPALDALVKIARVHHWTGAFPEPFHASKTETTGQQRRVAKVDARATNERIST